MRLENSVLVLGVVLLSSAAGCAGGGSGDSPESGSADIKQADCALAIDVTFAAPDIDSDTLIKKHADEGGFELNEGLTKAIATARAIKAIDAHAMFTNAAAGACNYKLTSKSNGSAIDGNLHTIGTAGRFFLRYEIGDALYNMKVDDISKTEIKLHGSSASVMVNDGGTEFHGEPDPSMTVGSVDVRASVPR